MKIRVLTIDAGTGTAETMRTIDYAITQQRQWLHRHMSYGLNNGKAIETWPVESDYDTDKCHEITAKWGHLPRHADAEAG